MADQERTMLLKFEDKGEDLPGESAAQISASDTLAQATNWARAFTANHFSLVKSFTFGMELEDNEAKRHAAARKRGGKGGAPGLGEDAPLEPRARHRQAQQQVQPAANRPSFPANRRAAERDGFGAVGGGTGAAEQAPAPFRSWRSATDDSWRDPGAYPTRIRSFSFTRQIDSASPILFDYCCQKQNFTAVSLIKRRTINNEDIGYLRIDLVNVLITGLDWSDDDIVEESCSMTCQEMHLTYKRLDDANTLISGSAGLALAQWISPAKLAGQG